MDFRTLEVDGPDRRYRLCYTTFGEPDAGRAIICVHGLTRNGRDFDALAKALADRAFVVCPDVIGRGRSEWLDDPSAYAVPTYAGHMLQLIQHLGVLEVDWIGTSMGGLIGMGISAMEDNPIQRLVLNDVGPSIPKAALERIGAYLSLELVFDSLAELEAHLRQIHAPFGPLSDQQWAHLAEHSASRLADSRFVLSYDPKIAEPFKTGDPIEDLDLWALWDEIRCPTLALRGADSDLLLPDTAGAMTERGPKAELVAFDGVGHAPALMDPAQIEVVKAWLFGTDARHEADARHGADARQD
ncbi:MAG: alpha/beta hydrolase [Alphaproteobacteria bacterium]|nr:alpha/beta hydrolase [Alphaproteobacteria bacterium]